MRSDKNRFAERGGRYCSTLFSSPRTQQPEKNEKLAEMAEKRKAEMEEKFKAKRNKLKKDQRRAPGGLVPVPIYALCQVQEEHNEIHLNS